MAGGKALTTLVIGDDYKAMWDKLYRRSVEAYAAKHGYELVVIDRPIDPGPRAAERTPHWQKCLILEHPALRDRDRVVWIDADIFVNFRTAPCIVEHYDTVDAGRGGIGAVPFGATFLNAETVENRWDRAHRYGSGIFKRERGPTPPERYAEAGLPDDQPDMVNTGVLVLRPDRHTAFLRDVYETGTENPHSAMEQMWLSYRMYRDGLLTPLDPRFNKIWSEELVQNYPFLMNSATRQQTPIIALCVTAAWLNGYFLHFLADGFSRGDVRYIMSMFDDPSQISLAALVDGRAKAAAPKPESGKP